MLPPQQSKNQNPPKQLDELFIVYKKSRIKPSITVEHYCASLQRASVFLDEYERDIPLVPGEYVQVVKLDCKTKVSTMMFHKELYIT